MSQQKEVFRLSARQSLMRLQRKSGNRAGLKIAVGNSNLKGREVVAGRGRSSSSPFSSMPRSISYSDRYSDDFYEYRSSPC